MKRVAKFKVGDRFFSLHGAVVGEHFQITEVNTDDQFYIIKMDRKMHPLDSQMRSMYFRLFHSFARRGVFIHDD